MGGKKDGNAESGILLLAKRSGLTSFASLSAVKRALKTKKVGHTGTLDSFADGLLVVLAGHLTRDETDEDSNDIMRIVMLERRLPPEKITPAIIRRTLLDLQFNLSGQALPRRYDTLKPRK